MADPGSTGLPESPDDLTRQAYVRAIRLLAAREHSRHELSSKLAKRGFEPDVIDAAMAQLQAAGYQDDRRFAQLLAEQRMSQGYGPGAIAAKLAQRGIDSSEARSAIESLSASWVDVATDALQRRFTQEQLADSSDRQRGRIARFLRSRGFSTGDALRALRQVVDSTAV